MLGSAELNQRYREHALAIRILDDYPLQKYKILTGGIFAKI
jgi:hypothetical protein